MSRAAAGAVLLVSLAVALGACSEKEENITTSATATEATQTVAPAIDAGVAEQRARQAASAAVPKGFTVKPGAWKVSCSGGESGGSWTCSVQAGPCSGKVIVGLPSGADANAITTDAKGVGCKAD